MRRDDLGHLGHMRESESNIGECNPFYDRIDDIYG